MRDALNKEEVAILIRARKILREKGMALDADVKSICEAAGVSRKSGYEWAGKLDPGDDESHKRLLEELERLKKDNEELKRSYDDLRFENEGRKLAWEIYDVDEFIALKKSTSKRRKNQK